MWLEPGRRAATVMGCVVAGAGAAEVLGTSRASQAAGSSTVSVLGWIGLVLLCAGLLFALVNLRRWRASSAVRRFVESEDSGSVQPDGIMQIAEVGSSRIPQLEIDWIPRRGLASVRAQRVTPDSNVAGRPPLQIAYLRLFDNQPRARTFLEGAWREFGTVFMLRSASSVSTRELRSLRRGDVGEDGIGLVRTRAQLLEAIASTGREPVRRRRARLTGLAPTRVTCWDWHGSYAPVAVLCHGGFWKEAVDELLLHVDLVCLDLSGFQHINEGTAYELQRVVDRFPLERVAFLCDPHSDTRYLAASIQQAWERMAVGSPNEGVASRWTQMAETDTFVTTIQVDQKGQERSRHTRLHARRRQTRRLAAELQRRVAAAPEPPRAPWRNPTGWVTVAPPRASVSGLSVLRTVAGVLVSTALVIGAFLAPSAIATQEQAMSARWRPPSSTHAVPTPVTDPGTGAGDRSLDVREQDTPDTTPDTTPPDTTPPDRGTTAIGTPTGISVPTVLGRTVDDAVATLTQAGLRSRIDRRPSTRPAGEVIGQDPEDGASVEPGRTVVLTVSTGPTPTNTPPPPTPTHTPPPPTPTTSTSTGTVTVPLPTPVTTTVTASGQPGG
jgi:hypothetical protein